MGARPIFRFGHRPAQLLILILVQPVVEYFRKPEAGIYHLHLNYYLITVRR